ncbi:MAG: c-type cytochrome [Gammaproteobacteria bacterium]|nr:c-type cytochrome [Gammaproteobacteria bacterium]
MNKPLLVAAAAALILTGCGQPDVPAITPPAVSTPAAPAAAAPAEAPAGDAAPAAEAPAEPAAAPAPAEEAAPAAAAASADGEAIYNKACTTCHATGLAGAPKLGDAADWGPRIAQGADILYTHSIKGFTGKKGMMPPKGGFMNLSDDEVKAAVDFMVDKAG